jgi:hypothetical protein
MRYGPLGEFGNVLRATAANVVMSYRAVAAELVMRYGPLSKMKPYVKICNDSVLQATAQDLVMP